MAPTTAELEAMRQAIALSALGLGTTSPNPPVGCVILDRHGQFAGAGHHERKGEPHAEVRALTAAGDRALGGVALVTLEPCNHVGVTPACRQALLDAKITRVLIAVLDPTSRGDGGAAVLAAAGVDVEVGVLADEALLVLQPWLTATRRHCPHVTWALTGTPDTPSSPALLDDLRQSADVVVLDGRLEEGIPSGHGPGKFSLPSPDPNPADINSFLNDMWSRGGRRLLVLGNSPEAKALLAAGMIDHIIIDRPRTTHGPSPGDILTAQLPPHFQITNIATVSGRIRIDAQNEARQ